MARLSAEEVRGALGDLPGWTLAADGAALEKVFQFRTFRQAMAFVNRVAELATEARHHPDIHISYNRVTLTLTTHDEGGLTEKDIALARRIEEVGEGESGG
ncbi:4a-hydroxytetrahydrobiopterin dehydratase [Sphaerobacter thermophilus]|jgi:4a-hydroxytetrahydrobiopterin dehydratase|uniref:4a-hydroxytetrahydrobiopterin dehydratase n=1 Tax=Sphaerobacter thermophilus TaxID=2057 RepID=UPI000DB6EB0D|nr:MAG: 4a-hydroxytetrahydrobiopterin dehydratase [Sphaerobacter thermophilus]